MLVNEIKKFFHGDVDTTEETRKAYARDYSIFEVTPEAVVFPKDAADVARLVKFVNKKRDAGDKNISLTGRSAGTDMTGGPLTESVVVSFTKYMNRVKEVGKDYAVSEPGVYFRDFEKAVAERGLIFPSYPASKDLCAMGGIVSNNSGGEKTLACGKTAKYVEELSLVMSDGEVHHIRPLDAKDLKKKLKEKSFEGTVYRNVAKLIDEHEALIASAKPNTTKNSSGYALWDVWDGETFDLTKLIVGSQGTLGLVTEMELRLVKQKPYRRLVVVFLRDIAPLASLALATLKFNPESFESYDDRTLGVALRFLPELVRSMHVGFVRLAFQFIPEAFMALKLGRFPKMVLLIELSSDDAKELETRTEHMRRALAQFPVSVRVIRSEAETEKYWTVRRQSFALLHNHNKEKFTAPFIDDIAVRPEYLPDFFPRLERILEPFRRLMVYTIAGHVGDGNFHIIPLMDMRDSQVRAAIPRIAREVYALVKQYRGTMTAEHNDGLIRTPYLEDMYGKKMCALFAQIKEIFDPRNIFNPGKKVGGDLDYSAEHMKKSNH